MRQFTAAGNDEGMRLSRFVLRVTQALPNSLLYKGFRTKRIKVNGRAAKPEYRLAAGDVIELYLNDEFFPEAGVGAGSKAPPPAAGLLPPFDTVYQSDALAVLYKPAGVFSHRDDRGRPGLLDAFTEALVRSGEYAPQNENAFAPALCNRLDYGTEGLLLAAKKAAALRDANEIIRLGLLQKQYLCVCVGTPSAGLHRAFLTRDRAAKTVRVTSQEAPGAKAIATEVAVQETAGGLSLCRVTLHTGRTHQIRAHLAFLGAPLAGDAKYGGGAWKGAPPLPHQALCAYSLRFAPRLPKASSLAALAGQSFEATMAALPKWWDAWRTAHASESGAE